MLYMETFTINIPPMLVYIPYMDPMGYVMLCGYVYQRLLRFPVVRSPPTTATRGPPEAHGGPTARA